MILTSLHFSIHERIHKLFFYQCWHFPQTFHSSSVESLKDLHYYATFHSKFPSFMMQYFLFSLWKSCVGTACDVLHTFDVTGIEKPIANTKTVLLRISAGMDPPSPLDSKLGALVKHHYLSWIFVLVLVGIEIAAQLITPYKRYVSQYMFVTGELKYPLKSNTVPFEAVPVCSASP